MIYKGWLNFEISSGIDYLRNLCDEIENMLNKRVENFSLLIEEGASLLTEEQKEQFYDLNLDEYWDLKKEFPDNLRKSIINTSYSFFENQLKSICKYIDNNYSYKIPQKTKKPKIHLYKEFIGKEKSIDFQEKSSVWETINQYRIVRNHLVHDYGLNVSENKEVMNIVAKNSELLVERDSLYVSNKYVLNFIDCISEYLLYISSKI